MMDNHNQFTHSDYVMTSESVPQTNREFANTSTAMKTKPPHNQSNSMNSLYSNSKQKKYNTLLLT